MKTLMPLNKPYCNIVLQLIYTGTLCTVNSQISEIFLFTAWTKITLCKSHSSDRSTLSLI